LHAAVKGGCYQAVKLLLNAGVNVHARDRENRSALLHAIASERVKIIELLIDDGAHLTEEEQIDIKMLLFKAVNLTDTCTLECLILAGADMSQSLGSITIVDIVSRLHN
jgi:ankyrin repeat protein